MDVHVHEPRGDDQAARVHALMSARGDTASHLSDYPVVDQHIGLRGESPRRIDHLSPTD